MSAFRTAEFMAHMGERVDHFHYYNELGSTNDEARSLGFGGAEHGSLVLAEYQSEGRGRRGAEWLSAPGEGLMFSIVLRPNFAREEWGRLALAAGLGIVEAMREDFSVEVMLKWPNDVMVGGKKCCGVLVEAQPDFVVIGVGVNVLAAPETYGCMAAASPRPRSSSSRIALTREAVLARLVGRIMDEVDRVGECFDFQRERMNRVDYLMGKYIQFEAGERSYEGYAQGISPAGNMSVKVAGCEVEFNQAFNIRVID